MRVLAVSFMLPPMLYPQAIQIGRLLEGCNVELATVSGRFVGLSAGSGGGDFDAMQRLIRRIELPHRTTLQGIWHRLAMRLVPFYGRSPDEFLGWSSRATAETGDWLASAPGCIDVLATFGEPMSDHLIGLELKRRFGIPWLAHFSDPWVDNPFRSFQPLANWRNRQLEASVVKAADSVVFTSDETRQLVMRKYPASWGDKAFVLPHSFVPSDFNGFPTNRQVGPLTIRYLGNFYGHRTPFPLISALSRLIARESASLAGVRIEIIGSVPQWMRFHPAIKRLPEGLLEFLPSVTYRHSLELMTSADLLLVIDAPAKQSVFLPSKLIDYIGAGRPIFGIVPPGASKSLIERLGGFTADPLRADEIDTRLCEAIESARLSRSQSATWGAASVREEFELPKVASDFRYMLTITRDRAQE